MLFLPFRIEFNILTQLNDSCVTVERTFLPTIAILFHYNTKSGCTYTYMNFYCSRLYIFLNTLPVGLMPRGNPHSRIYFCLIIPFKIKNLKISFIAMDDTFHTSRKRSDYFHTEKKLENSDI